MVRRGSHPRLSVILIVEGSPSYSMRALESIQNQDLYDIQIVIACRNAAPGVRHSLEVAADRDIHIDLVDVDETAQDACLLAGFAASRGSYIVAMGAEEWFAPHALAEMLKITCEASADVVFPSVSLDRYDAHRERHSRILDAVSVAVDNCEAVVDGLSELIADGLVCQTSGVMYERGLFDACMHQGVPFRSASFSAAAIMRARCVCGCSGARFHSGMQPAAAVFDPSMFARLSDDAKALDGVLESFAVEAGDDRLVRACHRFYYAHLVACIENLYLTPHAVSSFERRARLHDMLEAPRTRRMAAGLKGDRRGLGLLFGAIANARPARCVMYMHMGAFFNRTGAKTL